MNNVLWGKCGIHSDLDVALGHLAVGAERADLAQCRVGLLREGRVRSSHLGRDELARAVLGGHAALVVLAVALNHQVKLKKSKKFV